MKARLDFFIQTPIIERAKAMMRIRLDEAEGAREKRRGCKRFAFLISDTTLELLWRTVAALSALKDTKVGDKIIWPTWVETRE